MDYHIFPKKSKRSSIGYKIQIKLIGVLIHRIGSKVFMCHKNWPSDPNLTIEVIHRTLSSFNYKELPNTLFLQV